MEGKGAKVNTKDEDGNSLLMTYLDALNIDPTPETGKIVTFMDAHGADPSIRNSAGKTVFDIIDGQIARNGAEERWQKLAVAIREAR